MKILIVSLLMASSFAKDDDLKLKCEYHGGDSYMARQVTRCENSEVICYALNAGRGGGISCKFKEQKDTNENSN